MILTIRTDKPEAELGLYDNGKKLAYKKWPAHRELSATLHLEITKILQSASKGLEDLAGILVYKGPGSFTGLRIGVSTANALSYSLGVPIVGASGEQWVKAGLQNIKSGKHDKPLQINYGEPARTTKPKN